MRSRRNPKRDRDHKLEHGRNRRNEERRTDFIRAENFRKDGTRADKARTEITLENVTEPTEIPFQDRTVQTVRAFHIINKFLRNASRCLA